MFIPILYRIIKVKHEHAINSHVFTFKQFNFIINITLFFHEAKNNNYYKYHIYNVSIYKLFIQIDLENIFTLYIVKL